MIPVLNDRARLARCLRALGQQSYPSNAYEVVVVDNGSDTPIFDHAPRHPHVVVLNEPQPGSYAARNAGIRQARGDIIAFTDADCIPNPDWLRNGAEHLARLPEEAILAGRIERSHPDEHLNAAELYDRVFFLRQDLYVRLYGFAVTANLVVPASLFRRVGLFEPTLLSSGDAEWSRRARHYGATIHYADDVRVWHPTIATIPGLVGKARRVVGGHVHVDVRCGRRAPAQLGAIMREISDILPKWRRFRFEQRSQPTSAFLRVAALIVLIQLARAAERVWLLCGGRPRRQ